jgi:hypothetical protein
MSDPTPEQKMEQLLEELQEMKEEHAELSDYVDEKFHEERDEQAACEERINEAMTRIDELTAQMQEADPQLFRDLATAARDIAHKEAEVKKFCHTLALSKYASGAVFKGAGLQVKVSRSKVRRTYKPELLRKHPELENMYVDGDPVVVRTIDAAVLDRLVAEGKFDADEAKAFRSEDRIRNPQVRIRTADEEDEDEAE